MMTLSQRQNCTPGASPPMQCLSHTNAPYSAKRKKSPTTDLTGSLLPFTGAVCLQVYPFLAAAAPSSASSPSALSNCACGSQKNRFRSVLPCTVVQKCASPGGGGFAGLVASPEPNRCWCLETGLWGQGISPFTDCSHQAVYYVDQLTTAVYITLWLHMQKKTSAWFNKPAVNA